jgi:hypothetical protein
MSFFGLGLPFCLPQISLLGLLAVDVAIRFLSHFSTFIHKCPMFPTDNRLFGLLISCTSHLIQQISVLLKKWVCFLNNGANHVQRKEHFPLHFHSGDNH